MDNWGCLLLRRYTYPSLFSRAALFKKNITCKFNIVTLHTCGLLTGVNYFPDAQFGNFVVGFI